MSNFTKVSQNCVNLIKSFEGFKSKMYLCPAGIPTIGYGTAIDTLEEEYLKTSIINEEQATALLIKDLSDSIRSVNKFVNSNINQNQFDALCDFVYNCGVVNFKKSTLLKLVNVNPSNALIEQEFLKWTRADGKVLPGLVKRRKAECQLYFKDINKQF